MVRNLLNFFCFYIVLLCIAQPAIAKESPQPKLNISPQGDWISGRSIDYCRSNSNVRVVDTGDALDRTFLEIMRDIGVEVVIRYYGYDNNNPPPNRRGVSSYQHQKTLKQYEVELLREFGMASVAVFQYRGYSEATFRDWNTRAPSDAARALNMARALGQPTSTPIFFSVDADLINYWARDSEGRTCRKYAAGAGFCGDEIRKYFEIVSNTLRSESYEVGVYGSGEVCRVLTEAGHVSKCWLNFSSVHEGREWGLSSDKVVLQQLTEAKGAPKQCGNRNVDFNWIRAEDFGQFKF